MSAPWLEGSPEKLDAKRLDFGVELVGSCPHCGRAFRSAVVLTDPPVNTDTALDCYGTGCDHEWKVPVRINVSVELRP